MAVNFKKVDCNINPHYLPRVEVYSASASLTAGSNSLGTFDTAGADGLLIQISPSASGNYTVQFYNVVNDLIDSSPFASNTFSSVASGVTVSYYLNTIQAPQTKITLSGSVAAEVKINIAIIKKTYRV
jgi:hypothetical protein